MKLITFLLLAAPVFAQRTNFLEVYNGATKKIDLTSAGNIGIYHSFPEIRRVLIDSGGGSSSIAGIVRVFNGAAGAETYVAGMDKFGFTSLPGYRVGDTSSSVVVIDNLAAGFLSALTVTGQSSAATFLGGVGNITTINGHSVSLGGVGPYLDIGSGRMVLNGTVQTFYDSTLAQAKVSLSSGSGATGGIVATASNAGVFENRIDSLGFLTAIGYSVGTYGSGVQVIDGSGNATFGTGNITTINGNTVTLGGVGPTVSLASGRAVWNGSAFSGLNAALTDNKILLSWGGSGDGIIATASNAGVFQNRIDGLGFLTNIGYAVGTFGSGTTVIDGSRNASFVNLTISGTCTGCPGGSGIGITGNETGLTGNKSTSGVWIWGSPAGVHAEANSTNGRFDVFNGSNALRVRITQPGGSGVASGSVSTWTGNTPGSETQTNILDTNGINTTIAYKLNSVLMVDGSRNANFNTIFAGPTSIIGGVNFTGSGGMSGIAALSLTGSFQAASVLANGAFTFYPGATVTVGHCLTATSTIGDATWSACGSGSYVTTTGNQALMSGDKNFSSGIWTWGGVAAQRTEITSAGILTLFNGSNVQRVQLSNAGGGSTVSGSVSVSNASGVTSKMDNLGISSTVGYTANGSAGLTVTTTVRNSAGSGTCTLIYTFGLRTGGTC